MQNNSFQTIQELLNIRAGTLVAGLLGALITMLRRSTGSLQARITGYIVAILSVLYVVPFVLWLLLWKYNIELHQSAENLLAFVFGMISQTVTESFVDDPLNFLNKAICQFRRLKKMIWNGGDEKEKSDAPNTQKSEEKKND